MMYVKTKKCPFCNEKLKEFVSHKHNYKYKFCECKNQFVINIYDHLSVPEIEYEINQEYFIQIDGDENYISIMKFVNYYQNYTEKILEVPLNMNLNKIEISDLIEKINNLFKLIIFT